MIRLSSDCLFNYKQRLTTLCEILRNGFRHSLWQETLPFCNDLQENFICSFCDILPSQAAFHSDCYGKNALGLTREWGVNQGISPVRYIHRSSVGHSQSYQSLKFLYRSAGLMERYEPLFMLRNYLLARRLYLANKVPRGKFDEAYVTNPKLREDFKEAAEVFGETLSRIPKESLDVVMSYLGELFDAVENLHDELEARDAFLRAYVEDFTPASGVKIPQKILYDEREWRSVRFVAAKPDGSHVDLFNRAREDKFLPASYNLRFTAADLKYVVVASETDKEVVTKFVGSTSCLVTQTDLAARLVTFDELMTLGDKG